MSSSFAKRISRRSDQIASTAVERYLASSRHGSGMVFDARLQLNKCLDLPRLQDAWLCTVARTPQIYGVWSGKRQKAGWTIPPFDPTRFKVETIDHLDRTRLVDGLRPDQGVSAKLVISIPESMDEVAGDHVHLWFLFHHVACDGVGAIRIISKTLRSYSDEDFQSPNDGKATNLADAVDKNQHQKFDEGKPDESCSESCRESKEVPDPRNVWATVRGRNLRIDSAALNSPRSKVPSPLGLRSRDRSPSSDKMPKAIHDDPSVTNHRPETHRRVAYTYDFSVERRARLRELGVTLNDYAVAVALQSLAETYADSRQRFVCIMNPVQNRSWNQRRATRNHIGFAFIRRRIDEIQSLDDTIESVSKELTQIRQDSIADELAFGLSAVERVPGALRLIEKLGWFCPTASVTCLTNLKFGKRHGMHQDICKTREHADGRVLTDKRVMEPRQALKSTFVADAELKDVEIVGPLQAGGQLSITMWDSPRGISATFRPSDDKIWSACESIADRWNENFSTEVVT